MFQKYITSINFETKQLFKVIFPQFHNFFFFTLPPESEVLR